MKTFFIRALALVVYTGLSTFGISTGLGIEPLKAAVIAALFPLIYILRVTAKGLINDGKLDQAEIDAAINAGERQE